MSQQEWRSWFKNPNATGTFTFEAFNASEYFPPNESVDGWEATIQVASITEDPEADVPYPGIDISIKAPDGMRLPELNSSRTNSSNWHLCLSFWLPDKLDGDATDDAQDDDGDCSSFLPDECIDALSRREIRITGKAMSAQECLIMSLRHPTQAAQLTGEEDFAMSEEEAYEYAVRGVWIVLINWGRRNGSSYYHTSDILQPTLLCLHTRNFTEGSESPNAGARTTVYGPMAMFMTLLASTLLVY
ncbi:hypothetical protein FSARC_5856 [Fusarium sarcochroum]|uniref:Uncharacterized protein n=1 Tax=Fusarium sarcochroum TaxID=1208366 RepID=A0A8H4TYU4_9HYPO|nr:hypothetical protein FSARC_5856 [Fusarium sarcochroum]